MAEPGIDHYLKQFHFVADQRLKMFNIFFVVSVAALGYSLSTVLAGDQAHWEVAWIAGFGHALIGVVFFLLDRRNTEILKFA